MFQDDLKVESSLILSALNRNWQRGLKVQRKPLICRHFDFYKMGVSPSRTVFAAAAYAPVLLPQHPNSAVCPRKTDYGLFGSNFELSDHKVPSTSHKIDK